MGAKYVNDPQLHIWRAGKSLTQAKLMTDTDLTIFLATLKNKKFCYMDFFVC